MDTERRCLYCNEAIGLNWARANQKYCDKSCRDSFYYQQKYKKFYSDRYLRQKAEWARSPNGKRAGLKLYEWRQLPKEWR